MTRKSLRLLQVFILIIIYYLYYNIYRERYKYLYGNSSQFQNTRRSSYKLYLNNTFFKEMLTDEFFNCNRLTLFIVGTCNNIKTSRDPGYGTNLSFLIIVYSFSLKPYAFFEKLLIHIVLYFIHYKCYIGNIAFLFMNEKVKF